MTEPAGASLEVIAAEQLQALLGPLLAAAENPERREQLLAELGWDLAAFVGMPADEFEAWLTSLTAAVGRIAEIVRSGGPASLADVLDLLVTTQAAVDAVTGLPPSLQHGDAGDPGLLVEDLLTYLTVRRLRYGSPAAYHLLVLLGLLIPADQAVPSEPSPASGRPVRQPISRPALRLDRLGDMFADPVSYLQQLHAPQGIPDGPTADAVADRVLSRLAKLLQALGVDAQYGINPDALPSLGETGPLAAHMLRLSVDTTSYLPSRRTTAEGGVSIALSPADRGGLGVVFVVHGEATLVGIAGRWLFELALAGGDVAVSVNKSGALVSGGGAEVDLHGQVTYLADESGVALVLGGRDSTRIELGGLIVELIGHFGPGRDHGILFTVSDAAFVLAAREGDGFLQKALPKEIRIGFPLGVGWSHARGLYVTGGLGESEGIGGTIDVAVALGPVKIPSVYIAARPTAKGLKLVVAVSADAALGPVVASLDRTGLSLDVTFPGSGGNLGPANVVARFEPPAGIGLSLSAGIVSGTGYLFPDADADQYGGAVELRIGPVAVQAIGLLSTRMPDGRPGFSLLVLVSVRFPAIQLGLGFALTALGGLVGVHRTVAVDELRKGLQAGSLDSLLFPPDLAHNARQVVNNLGRYFPTRRDQYVFGPAAEIVWGTPPLVTIQLGLFLELPTPVRLILVGKLRMTLPTAEAPVLVLKLDLLGELDFADKTLALDAVLRDSRVAAFTLTGSAAVRLAWGERPGFLLSAGGFHPSFTPPGDVPAQQRLAVALSDAENPRLRLSAYFALTSNTVQIGARLDLYASLDVRELGTFSVGALVSFDALFQVEPFSFVIDLTIAASLEWNHEPILGLRLDLTLSGPDPWHAVGTATFSLFGQHSIGFDVIIGEPPAAHSIPPVDVADLVRKALSEPDAWHVEPPARLASLATLRDGDHRDDETVFLHPLGTLSVTQKVAPLDLELTRFGEARIDGATTIRLDGARIGDASVTMDTLTEQFAPARFQELTDAEKLAAPSFQRLSAGATLNGVSLTLPKQIRATDVEIAQTVVDPGPVLDPISLSARSTNQPATARIADRTSDPARPLPGQPSEFRPVDADALFTLAGGAAAAQVGPAAKETALLASPAVTLVDATYTVVASMLQIPDGVPTQLPTYAAADGLRALLDQPHLLVVESSEVTG